MTEQPCCIRDCPLPGEAKINESAGKGTLFTCFQHEREIREYFEDVWRFEDGRFA